MTIGEVLDLYGAGHARGVKSPQTIGYSLKALRPYFGPARVASINRATCEAYVRHRNRSNGTTRRELAHLNAAINWCKAEGALVTDVVVTLPPAPPARDRWLTRDEVAALIRACRRRSPHLARFILAAVYTGTRSEALRSLQFMPNTEGGWVDTSRSVMYRRASGAAETRKRDPARAGAAPPVGSHAALGTPGRPLGCRVRRPARDYPQDRMAHHAPRGGHRALFPARPAADVRDVAHAGGRRPLGRVRLSRHDCKLLPHLTANPTTFDGGSWNI